MTGKNHLISNIASAIILASSTVYLQTLNFSIPIININFHDIIGCGVSYFTNTQGINMVLFITLACVLYVLGTLLPDIDSKNSILGRIIYIPIEHRTWTHTLWIPLILITISIWCRAVIYLALGYALHLFWDSLSRGGVCYFYPISKYKHFGNTGAKIKKGHFLYLYRTGKTSEIITVTVVVTVAVIALIFLIIAFI